MKNLFLLTILFVISSFNCLIFCQQDNGDKQIIQLATGKEKITFKVLDYETNKPLIGAAIYSFNLQKILATIDIDGVATYSKGVRGTIEVSANNYSSVCFKLDSEKIDSIVVRLKFRLDHIMGSFYPTISDDSLKIMAEFDANNDINEGEVFLYFSTELTEEQFIFSKNHLFTFKEWRKGGYSVYKTYYNEVVLNYLSKKFKTDIRQTLSEICWRND